MTDQLARTVFEATFRAISKISLGFCDRTQTYTLPSGRPCWVTAKGVIVGGVGLLGHEYGTHHLAAHERDIAAEQDAQRKAAAA